MQVGDEGWGEGERVSSRLHVERGVQLEPPSPDPEITTQGKTKSLTHIPLRHPGSLPNQYLLRMYILHIKPHVVSYTARNKLKKNL